MKGKNIILVVCAALLLAVATVWIILPAFAYKMSSLPGISVRGRKVALSSSDGAYKLTGVTRETSQGQVAIELPTILKGVPPRTAITLKAQIAVGWSDSLLVKSVFTPMRIYLDGELAYAYGEEGSYPSFLNDPPTNLFILPLPQNGEPVSLRIEYLSPSQRSEISLPALYVGSEGELFANLVHANGFSFVFSCVLLFLGTAMIFPYVLFLRHVSGGSSFLWLGLFSLSAGMWIMGECDLSVFIFPYPSLLHAIDYLGLLFLTFPFLCFGMVVLNPQNPRPFTIMLAIHVVSLLAAITLQLCGAVDLIRTLYWFHIITPLGFLVFAADLLWEYFRYKNAAAKRFVPAVGLLTIAVLLELLNYWLKGNSAFTVIFQFGLLTFIVSLGIVSGYYVRQSMRAAGENLRLEYEMGVMERQLALQQEQYGRMMQNAHEIRTMRHDMRHHLAALGQLLDSGGAAEKAKT
ncbi:MAG: hypothetical protein EOM66_05340, partial [Clostridia bacterium]|nr:hypothetical protein [Clostridia bacterium]